MRPHLVAALGLALLAVGAAAVKPFSHDWATVGSIMGMHGKYKTTPSQRDVEFVARNYPLVTTGTGCSATVNATPGHTIEDSVLGVAARIKAVNPDVKVGMYWRSDFALELADCSGFSAEWNAHASEWRLRNDSGGVIEEKEYIDYTNPAAAAFFARVLVNVTTAAMPTTGSPVLDFVYIDGDPGESSMTAFKPGIGPERSAKIVAAIYATFADIQRQLDARGHGQKVVLNGMDTAWSAQCHVATGTAGSMFDHWSILQFLNRSTGAFNATMMDEAFQLVTSPLLSNVTVEIKGWPGPIIRQRDEYPPTLRTPKTPAELQRVAGERFNSELALFLLVAGKLDFWLYSWFWGFDDYVPNNADSSVPAEFFPQAKCALGEPLGPMQRVGSTWTYTRKFQHASVLVDLSNRTASRVDFDGCSA